MHHKWQNASAPPLAKSSNLANCPLLEAFGHIMSVHLVFCIILNLLYEILNRLGP